MVQFHVLELNFSWSAHFTSSEPEILARLDKRLDKIRPWAIIDRNWNTFFGTYLILHLYAHTLSIVWHVKYQENPLAFTFCWREVYIHIQHMLGIATSWSCIYIPSQCLSSQSVGFSNQWSEKICIQWEHYWTINHTLLSTSVIDYDLHLYYNKLHDYVTAVPGVLKCRLIRNKCIHAYFGEVIHVISF